MLAVPALRALRRRFGDGAKLILAAQAAAARLLQTVGEVDTGLAFDDPSLAPLFAGEPHQDDREKQVTVAWMRIESAPGLRDVDVAAPGRPSDSRHCATYLVETLAPLGIPPAIDAAPLCLEPIATAEVLLHPGSGSTAKNWPAERYADVIRMLHSPARLVVGEADVAVASAVEHAFGKSLPKLLHPDLEELAARLAGCHAYVGNDSGVSHLAGLSGARTVVLFGPTSPSVWRPLGPSVQVRSFETPPSAIAALVEAISC
jgi:ADP-heptose:LPS heptosyltransferase